MRGMVSITPNILNFKPQTPQGDGNASSDCKARSCLRSNFKPQTPQGDGNSSIILGYASCSSLISNHKPRKGTETEIVITMNMREWRHFKPQTPQGDGNQQESRLYAYMRRISNHKPRKGTETAYCSTLARRAFRISNHKPRKGTETAVIGTPNVTMVPYYFKPQTPQGDGNHSPLHT